LSHLGCFPAEALHPSQGETTYSALRASNKHHSAVWYLASWNVLVDEDGTIETSKQCCDHHVSDVRKIDSVVNELQKYKIYVAGLQETKWFGDNVHKVADSVVLTSGRKVPIAGRSGQRGEGVAIVLNGPAIQAWMNGGSQWKAWRLD